MGAGPLPDAEAALVLTAMRLAEFAHRSRPGGPHRRKAPEGHDRPAYFIHLAEVGWLLSDAGCDAETVAAGYLHGIIEDCGYSEEQLAEAIGNERVTALVAWVSEPARDATGAKQPWDERNAAYPERMRSAPEAALALSCADKTANLHDMVRYMADGHAVDSFTSRDHPTQLAKFEALAGVYVGRVPERLLARYHAVLGRFRALGA